MFLHMTVNIMGSFLFYFSYFKLVAWGGSVAKLIAARVSIITLIHSNWITVNGELPSDAPPMKTIARHTMLITSWNCRNFLMLSRIVLPHCVALKTELKLSSKMIMSAASFATSQPDTPMQKPTCACFKAPASLIPSAVTATYDPTHFNPTINANLSSGVDLASTLIFSATFLNLALSTVYYSFPSLSLIF